MNSILRPRWLLLINTLPVIILFLISWGEYTLIQRFMKEDTTALWQYFGIALAFLAVGTAGSAVWLEKHKKTISLSVAIVIFALYTAFLYVLLVFYEDILPRNVPNWMISDTPILYAGTFLMPTLAYLIFVIVIRLTPQERRNAWTNFGMAIAIPVALYFFITVVSPLWRFGGGEIGKHFVIVCFIIITTVFLFFLVRGVYIITQEKSKLWLRYQLLWKIPIGLILPLFGLALNNGHILHNKFHLHGAIFGDFSNEWFYILAIANGIITCLPALRYSSYRLPVFLLRTVLFGYVLYFFLVFLPFLPVSLALTIVVGVGFLMLSPAILFIICCGQLRDDFKFLLNFYSSRKIISIAAAAFLVLPAILTARYMNDRIIIHRALDYVYAPNYSQQYHIDTTSLVSVLNVVRKNKSRRNEGLVGGETPYLSSYYNWLVLDNLMLSDAKISILERIFLGKNNPFPRDELRGGNTIPDSNFSVSFPDISSTYDSKRKLWTSKINMQITRDSVKGETPEYATSFELPVGCWISDYYLYVGSVKERGILAEKKAATWIYEQITSERKDPGILYYLTGNTVGFRISPFVKNETRKTGIELIHIEPVEFVLAGKTLRLGMDPVHQASVGKVIETENAVYIPTHIKSELPLIERRPYFNIILDVSAGNEIWKATYVSQIEKLLQQHKGLSENSVISCANAYTTSFSIDSQWKTRVLNHECSGGFFIERAIQHILYSSFTRQDSLVPVILVITDNFDNAILESDFADFALAFPDYNRFYIVGNDNTLYPHSLVSHPKLTLPDTVLSFVSPVRVYSSKEYLMVFLPNNNKPDILLKPHSAGINFEGTLNKNATSALALQAAWIGLKFHPERTENDWIGMVRASFATTIMSPLTSYIVVETEAQREVLRRKQQQTLSGKKQLDIGRTINANVRAGNLCGSSNGCSMLMATPQASPSER